MVFLFCKSTIYGVIYLLFPVFSTWDFRNFPVNDSLFDMIFFV